MKRLRCPGCGKWFRTPQALGNHRNFCGKAKAISGPSTPDVPHQDQPEQEKSGGTRVPERREPWDVNWSQAQKEAAILRDSGFEWGIGRRGGRWVPVPVIGGMDYDLAVIAADKRNAISRIEPVLVHRSFPSAQEPDSRDDDLFLALVLLDTL